MARVSVIICGLITSLPVVLPRALLCKCHVTQHAASLELLWVTAVTGTSCTLELLSNGTVISYKSGDERRIDFSLAKCDSSITYRMDCLSGVIEEMPCTCMCPSQTPVDVRAGNSAPVRLAAPFQLLLVTIAGYSLLT